MNVTEVMGLFVGALQFIVAGYALRLNRLFGTARVGWSLFCAFALLALLHLIQAITPFHTGEVSGVKIEVMYLLISLLLLIGMVHMETLLKERRRLEGLERQLRAELELEVKRKTSYLVRAFEGLQAEMNERKAMEAEAENANTELFFASRQMKAAAVTTSVLHNMGKMLESVNISANIVSDQVKQSKIANVVHVGALIREHAAELGDFMAHDPRGRKLPEYIAELASHLAQEQAALSQELESLKKYIEQITAMQQSCTQSGWPGDPLKAAGLVEIPQ